MFAIELRAGWVVFLQFFEVFDSSESFWVCIFWDVLFHLRLGGELQGVSVLRRSPLPLIMITMKRNI